MEAQYASAFEKKSQWEIAARADQRKPTTGGPRGLPEGIIVIRFPLQPDEAAEAAEAKTTSLTIRTYAALLYPRSRTHVGIRDSHHHKLAISSPSYPFHLP
ncbi:hypothetical protein CDD80_3651 [Ophiocordyceps camponoti-rufipedis]|uniref:Uncharacterized protein n=1 Tax=Ophiocordyceps camponoti-rufipedis TaxID=2004952 RepID=A0A2C5Z0X4_9HYPO|nr:hypothetical protein CDD80_3651 [Ophiocordyceps camponoti-rufipedis]